MSVLHVAVDAHDLARDERGIGRYARAVLSRAQRRDDLRITYVVRGLFPRRAPIRAVLGDDAARVTSRVPRDAQVLWSPWNGTFLRAAIPNVATIHDVVPFAFPAAEARAREHQQAPFRRTAGVARRVLADSSFTAGEAARYLGIPHERIAVVPLGVDPSFSADGPAFALEDGRRYVLHVGDHEERKNTATLLAAWERAFPSAEVALVFTRRPPRVPAGALVLPAAGDAELAARYRGAAAFALPSTYEGFGLPLLEALACGAPALAARAASLPEVGGDAATWIDEPRDVDAWAAALRALVGDPAARERARREGPARAASFRWERCVDATLAVLREAAA